MNYLKALDTWVSSHHPFLWIQPLNSLSLMENIYPSQVITLTFLFPICYTNIYISCSKLFFKKTCINLNVKYIYGPYKYLILKNNLSKNFPSHFWSLLLKPWLKRLLIQSLNNKSSLIYHWVVKIFIHYKRDQKYGWKFLKKPL